MERPFDPTPDDNHVQLRGRLAADTLVRTLPSGDELCLFRVTVYGPASPGGRERVDSISCVAVRARPRRSLERCHVGDWLELTGSLHRRFWRSPSGPTSRYEVEVREVRVIARRRSDAGPVRKRASG